MDILPILRALSRNKLRFALIAGQIAISLSIVANCVALVLDAREKMSVRLGHDDAELVSGMISAPKTKLRDTMERQAWFQKNLDEIRVLPGVRSLSACGYWPWSGISLYQIKVANTTDEPFWVGLIVTDEFFPDTIGLVVDEGRWFTHDEVQKTIRLWYAGEARERHPDGKARERGVGDVVITRALGERLFGGGSLLGKQFEDQDGDIGTVIGVVRELYNPAMVQFHNERYVVFYPGGAHSYTNGARFVARADPGKADEVADRINEWVRSRYEMGVKPARTAAEMHDLCFGPQRTIAALMTLLVFLLLFVASLAIAGLTSSSVTERTRQIGTRRALGATTNDILLHFITESGILTAAGLVVGAGLAVPLNIALLRIYETAKLDAWILGGSALLLFLVALGAALPPALRASRVSPAIATRNV